MIIKPPPISGLTVTLGSLTTITPIKGRRFINQGSTLGFRVLGFRGLRFSGLLLAKELELSKVEG